MNRDLILFASIINVEFLIAAVIGLTDIESYDMDNYILAFIYNSICVVVCIFILCEFIQEVYIVYIIYLLITTAIGIYLLSGYNDIRDIDPYYYNFTIAFIIECILVYIIAAICYIFMLVYIILSMICDVIR